MKNKMYMTPKFKEARLKMGWSQREMADAIKLLIDEKITQTTVSKWEKQIRPIDMQLAVWIARYLKIDIKDLIERK